MFRNTSLCAAAALLAAMTKRGSLPREWLLSD